MTSEENTSTSRDTLDVRWLGRIGFQEGLALQNALVLQRRDNEIPDTVLLLEHEPVYTIGRTRDRSSLLDPEQLPHELVEINRGGKATYHGPGQLVGYFILDLHQHGRDLHALLRMLEGLVIDFAHTLGVKDAQRREGLTGVWVGERKLASIGVGVRHWISMHGFAINICGDLSPFGAIIPCGIDNVTMTSIAHEHIRTETLPTTLSPAAVADAMAQLLPAQVSALRSE